MVNISINDTHRLPYMKGRFTAIRLGTGSTTPVKFYDSDGQELGYTIYTNSEGFICDSNGNLLGNGVFLHEDAVVNGYYNGARFVQWVVRNVNSDLQVNDGKLLNGDGIPIWSANSPNNYTLKWSDIANRPKLNEWSEDEQVVLMTTTTSMDNVAVNKFTKIMTIGFEDALPESDAANITLAPVSSDSPRYGQTVFVQLTSPKAKELRMWNNGDNAPFCTIPAGGNALIALLSNGRFVALTQSSGSGEFSYERTTLLCNQVYNLDSASPAYIIITDISSGGSTMYQRAAINASGLGSVTRRALLLWQPNPEFGNMYKKLRIYGDSNTMALNGPALLELLPYRACEVYIAYDANSGTSLMIPLGFMESTKTPILQASPSLLSDSGVTNVVMQSASTVVDLGLSSGTTPSPETKKVFPIRVEIPTNYEGDITIMNSSSLTHLTNFEIQIGFKSGNVNLSPSLTIVPNPSLLNDMMVRVYRSSESDGANKGKFFAIFHVISLSSGGIFLRLNPEPST